MPTPPKQKPRKSAKSALQAPNGNSEGEDITVPDIGAYRELCEALDTLAVRIANAKATNAVTNGLYEELVSHFYELAYMLNKWDGVEPFTLDPKGDEK